MMKLIKDEQGVTLMELLAAIVILLMFGSIVWGFLFQSIKFNDTEVSKQQLKTEANLIINTIQQNHVKKPAVYRIIVMDSNSKLMISNINNINGTNTETVIQEFNKPGIQYKLYCKQTDDYCPESSEEINYISSVDVFEKSFPFRLEIRSATNEKIFYKIETTFSRISK